MWNRKVLKEQAKFAFKANYWKCVLVSLLMQMVLGGTILTLRAGGRGKEIGASFNEALSGNIDALATIVAVLGGIVIVSVLIATAFSIFVRNPLSIGGDSFYVKNAERRAEIGNIFDGFTNQYMRNVGALFLRDLFIVLGLVCFVIPGIILTYSFRMVPYILSDESRNELQAMDVIKLSCSLMKKSKWRAFVLDLSFIGWEILSGLTFGILKIFYVKPYEDATNAELYKALTIDTF